MAPIWTPVLCTATLLLLAAYFSLKSVPLPQQPVSLNTARRELESKPPLIYIYDLPEQFKNWTAVGDVSDTFYGLDQLFPALLRNSTYVTTNMNEATYFLVEAWLYWNAPNIDDLIKELQKVGPKWDLTGGADHIFIVTKDHARCEFDDPRLKKSIFLSHFGSMIGSQQRWGTECNLFERYGDECDNLMRVSEAGIFKREYSPCFIPRQDIVVPPTCYEPHPGVDHNHTWRFKTPYIHKELAGRNRTKKLFYSGVVDLHKKEPDAKSRPWSDAYYTFGARQSVYRMFHNTTGFEIMTHHAHEDYWSLLSESIFCLATAGWGWGNRFKVAATRGCIPVIIQDAIEVEFEEQLNMKEYALRVPLWSAHKLPDILQVFIDTGKAAQMQKVLNDCAWRFHWWRRPEGRAFELVICELKRRMYGAPQIKVDFEKCTLDCGDGKVVELLAGYNNV